MKSQELEIEDTKKKFWKPGVLFLIFILILAGFAIYESFGKSLLGERITEENSKSIKVGSLAPDFTLEDIDGNKITLSSFQNKKPVLLVFWATWCGYCAKELPDLKDFIEIHRNEIETLVISSGESKKTVEDYIEKKDINFTMLLDNTRDVWNSYLVRGTPSHFLIDSKGKIIALRPGLALKDNLEIMLSMLTELW